MAKKRTRRRRGVFPIGERPQTTYTYGKRIAAKFGLTMTSLYRSPEHNAAIGGAPNSWHTKGMAVDFVPSDGNWSRLDKLSIWLRLRFSRKLIEGPIWRSAGHYDHLHLAFNPSKVKPSKKQL
jgi:hypothetical protein